jgi:parallel beta helix pectate lyase-like protein
MRPKLQGSQGGRARGWPAGLAAARRGGLKGAHVSRRLAGRVVTIIVALVTCFSAFALVVARPNAVAAAHVVPPGHGRGGESSDSTPSPYPTVTSSPSPSPSPSPTPSPASYPIPTTLAADCSVDITSALTTFINSVPDDSIITFAPGGCYLAQGTLEFSSRNGLTFEGNGASIKATTIADDTRSHWRFLYGSDINFHNMTIVGPDMTGYDSALQHQMGIDLRGVTGSTISAMTIENVYGDCLYVGVGYDNTTWTTNVYAHDNTCVSNGRSGVSITAGDGINLDHNTIIKPGLWGVDIEPNGGTTGATFVHITNSTFSPGRSLEPFVQVVGASGGGLVHDITISGNAVQGMTLTTQFVPAVGQRWSNFTFSNNTSDTSGYLLWNDSSCGCTTQVSVVTVVNVHDIDGITISNNYQPGPGTDEDFIYATGSCSLTQSGNQFPGGGVVAVIEPYSCP